MRCSDFKIAVVGILFLLPCLSAAQIRTGANGEPLPTYKGTGIPKLKNSTAAMLTGITIIGVGAGRRNKIEKRYRASRTQPELSICPTPGGAGLCFRF